MSRWRKKSSQNRSSSVLPNSTKTNSVLGPPAFHYEVCIDNILNATTKNDIIASIKQLKEKSISLDRFSNYTVGFLGEVDNPTSQEQFIRLFLNDINQESFMKFTNDSKKHGHIYLRPIESNKLNILFMNSYLKPKNDNESILDKKIKDKFIRGYFYFHSTILLIFVDNENSKAIKNILKDCYSMGHDKTIYVIHSIIKGKSKEKHTEMCKKYDAHEFINYNDEIEKFYWYNLKEDTEKRLVHLLYEDNTNTDNHLNKATFGFIEAIFNKVNQNTQKDEEDKSCCFPFTFSNYLCFFLQQLYSYSNINNLEVKYNNNKFTQTLKPTKAKIKSPGLLNTNNHLHSEPGYYYEKKGEKLIITTEAWSKIKSFQGKIANDYYKIDLNYDKDTEERTKTFCNFPGFIRISTIKIPTRFALIKGFDKQYYSIARDKSNGKVVITFDIHDKPETNEEEEEDEW